MFVKFHLLYLGNLLLKESILLLFQQMSVSLVIILLIPFSPFEGRKFEFKEVSIKNGELVLCSSLVVTDFTFILMYQVVSKVLVRTASASTMFTPLCSIIDYIFLR